MLQLAHIFQDGMMLQRNKPFQIWGQSDCDQKIAVTLNGTYLAEFEVGVGNFSIKLPQQSTLFNATLSITDNNDTLVFQNVDFGEVWIAGGQSNMEFPLLHDVHGQDEIALADDEHLRFFNVGKYSFEGEKTEGLKDDSGWDRWINLQPETAPLFSAVGYYFAKKLRKHYKIPVAIIGCNWGGTSALTWIDEPYLNDMKELRHYLETYRLCLKELDMDKYIEQNRQMREWMASDEMIAFQKKIADGHVTPLILIKAIRYQKKFSDTLNHMGPHYINRPTGLYHCMVQKIAGFTCAGVIWYQGESDEDKADIYELLLSSVIACWRNAWQVDFPFLFVQLAPFGRRLHLSGIRFPIIRRKQELVSKSVANAYMISIMDAGEKADIHPKNKQPVGERLALMAMGKVYGSPVQCEPPELSVGTQSTGCIRLLFEHTGNGLELWGKRVCALQLKVNGKEIKSFYFTAAGREIEIRSNKIKPDSDCSVQFAQTGYCSVNIYNSTGLPVKPFTWYSSDIER